MIQCANLLRMFFIVSCCAVVGGLGCKHATNPPPTPPKPLALLQPVGGEHYKVGDTVHIKWQNNDSTHMQGVVVDLIKDGVLFDPIPVPGIGSFPLDTTWYNWKIDSTMVSNNCRIKVHEYNYSVPSDSSGIFSITLN